MARKMTFRSCRVKVNLVKRKVILKEMQEFLMHRGKNLAS